MSSLPPLVALVVSDVADIYIHVDNISNDNNKDDNEEDDDNDNIQSQQRKRSQWMLRSAVQLMATAILMILLPNHRLFVTCIWARRVATPHAANAWASLLDRVDTTTANPGTFWLRPLQEGGPLGRGCRKLVEILVGTVVLFGYAMYNNNNDTTTTTAKDGNDNESFWSILQSFARVGPLLPNLWLPAAVVLVSFVVNVVLWAWSRALQTRGSHPGVHDMVQETLNRSLSVRDHAGLATWAWLNALCEEVEARGLNRAEFQYVLMVTTQNTSWSLPYRWNDPSNVWQAAVFGLSHYYGIPSGATGVALTFVYGWIMASLADIGGGLLYPVLAHTMADYYIFAAIARRTNDSSNNSKKKR